jgi:hypothetical protein
MLPGLCLFYLVFPMLPRQCLFLSCVPNVARPVSIFIKSIFQIIVKKKWRQLNIWPNFKPEYPERTKLQSPTAASCPKIIGPEQNVNLICNASLYTHIPKIKSISPSIAKKEMTTKYLTKFQNPRAITRPKIIGLEQNVQ